MAGDTNRVEVPYRGHKIIAASVKGEPTAAIYLGKTSASAERFKGSDIVAAVDQAKQWIDTKYAQTAATRPAPHIATVQEYVDALRARPPKENELAMLKAHVNHQILTATQLADAAGYQSYSSANVHYGTFGREISEMLHLAPKERADGSLVWTSVLAHGLDADGELSPEYRWQIHPQLVEALNRLGIC